MKTGTLYLIPVPLGPSTLESVLPPTVQERAANLRFFIAENAKSARAFLKQLPSTFAIQDINIAELNKQTPLSDLDGLLAPLLAGEDVGLVSEAGCPAIADPGALIVARAHKKGVRVVPLIGPSSILLALMASGLSGQCFMFHGYLTAKESDRPQKIAALEASSRREERTEIFIETPYRNLKLLSALIRHCREETRICIAANLSLANEYIITKSVRAWRQDPLPDIDKQPCLFLLQA